MHIFCYRGIESTNINSVFAILNVSLLAISQFLRHWISMLICSWSLGILQAVKVKLVSSAYILVRAKSVTSIMLESSLMYIKNSNGPSIEPWGTPHYDLFMFGKLTIDENSVGSIWEIRLNHSNICPRTLIYSSLVSRRLWSTVSKAFLRSKNKTPVNQSSVYINCRRSKMFFLLK